uniref:Ig-like domain-containing protein n=1 Tax=Latimeria chalumnae TaxID=7897 RepID=M3XIR6_LATCH
ATLLLKNVQISDQGVYDCYVSTVEGKKEGSIKLKVAAPSKNSSLILDIQNGTRVLNCSTVDGFPLPSLNWLDESGIECDQESKKESINTKTGLFSVTSTLHVRKPNTAYYCTIQNYILNQTWTGSWKLQDPVQGKENTQATILCAFHSKTGLRESPVSWDIRKLGESSSIITCHGEPQQCKTDETYRNRIISTKNLTEESVSFFLKDLSSSDEGEYLCSVTSESNMRLFSTPLSVVVESQLWRHRYPLYSAAVATCVLCALFLFGIIKC